MSCVSAVEQCLSIVTRGHIQVSSTLPLLKTFYSLLCVSGDPGTNVFWKNVSFRTR